MSALHLVRFSLLGLLACSGPSEIKEKNFAASGAGMICNRLQECQRGDYLREYYGHADCASHWEIALEVYIEVADDLDCDYSPEAAARAYNNLAEMSCEDFYGLDYIEDFDEIWDDCALGLF
ncbi:MAG: hypothetical protein GWP91_06015 [Rhodobacterales bacterium]|nr:hypothetical protein [Rhodobacterales bacterium]